MIKLRNIKKNNHIIECDILPENSKEYGHLVVDLASSNQLVTYSLSAGYEWCIKHVYHALHKLVSLSELSELPKDSIVVWY